MPRLRDIADRKLGTFEPASAYPAIATLIGRPINVAIIRECWDEIVRLTASIKAKTVLPSGMLRKLAGHQRQNGSAACDARVASAKRRHLGEKGH